jgi:hypothetical protein
VEPVLQEKVRFAAANLANQAGDERLNLVETIPANA